MWIPFLRRSSPVNSVFTQVFSREFRSYAGLLHVRSPVAHLYIYFNLVNNQKTINTSCRFILQYTWVLCRSQWPRGLRRKSAAARLLRSWVRITPGAWMSVCCECYVLSGRGLCEELITRPEESYRLWRVFVCDLETSWMRKPWPALGCSANKPNEQPECCTSPALLFWILYGSGIRFTWTVANTFLFSFIIKAV
jgi:hypothetical protein